MGQDEEAPSSVPCARFSRREEARLCAVAQLAKAADDVGEAQGQVAFDIFAPDPFGLGFVDDAGDLGPEVAWIFVATSTAGIAERLAGIAGRDEMYSAAERSAVEGSQIIPDRSLIQGLVRHPGHESGRCMGFPLDESHGAIVGLGDVEAEIEAGIAGTEGDAPKVTRLGVVVGT